MRKESKYFFQEFKNASLITQIYILCLKFNLEILIPFDILWAQSHLSFYNQSSRRILNYRDFQYRFRFQIRIGKFDS